MNQGFQIGKQEWLSFLLKQTGDYNVYVPVKSSNSIEYELFDNNRKDIAFNIAKPVTPLKTFFLPVKENVIIKKSIHNKNIIVGIPSCDLAAIDLLDKIYLDNQFVDQSYKINRENSILIGADCFEVQEHCHCVAYDINPYPEKNHDISTVSLNGEIIIFVQTEKGQELFQNLKANNTVKEAESEKLKQIEAKRKEVKEILKKRNPALPNYKKTGELISKSKDDIWEKHSKTCVSCGACATICPSCTCFLLIDRPDFEKVRQLDACQYPGFERIAAGEDPLGKKILRFRNRYMCKYVWKPDKFNSTACTGCGRCIESCIGNINKNEIFVEMEGKKSKK